jgi:predicted ATPase
VDDEHVYRLGTLEVPEPDQIDLALAGENGAIQLFVARAQAASSRFVLGAENVDSVVDICRQLDGLPLAIELAAARVPLLGARGVQQRLNDRFHLLTAGSRFSLRRHQTLLGAIEWSYGLLSEREQSLLDRLGVFVGSFSMESVQQLASDAAQDSWAVLDDLGTLVDKSLVIANGDVVPRYRLLEATRAFALSRLAARGETPTTLRRHAQVMLALFEQGFQDALGGALNDALVARLLPDLDNLRGALRWAGGDNGDLQTAVALIGAAGAGHGFLWNAGLQWEGWQWCEALRQRVDGTVPAVFSARYWLACAELGIAKSIETALEDARRALSQYQSVGDRLGEFLAWDALSYCLVLAGRYDEAFAVLPDLSRVLDPSWPLRLSSIYENQAGLLFLNAGRLDEGRMHLAEYLRLSRLMGSESDELTAVSLLADVEIASGQADRAVELMREALAHIDPELSVGGLEVRNYATALLEAGRLEEAEAAFRNASLRARRALGTVAFVLHDAASLLAQLERIDDAARIAAYAESVYERVGRKPRLVARRNIEKLKTLLATKRSAEALEQLAREGRSLTEEQATLLAFPPR